MDNEIDRELLTVLIEECSEVVHIGCKILRHGLNSYHPNNVIQDNQDELCREVGQVLALIDMLRQRRVLQQAEVDSARSLKFRTLPRFLHHSTIVEGKIRPREKRS